MEKYFDLNKTGRITKTDVFFHKAETAEPVDHLLNFHKVKRTVFCILNFNLGGLKS